MPQEGRGCADGAEQKVADLWREKAARPPLKMRTFSELQRIGSPPTSPRLVEQGRRNTSGLKFEDEQTAISVAMQKRGFD
jgi:hypothetical protein